MVYFFSFQSLTSYIKRFAPHVPQRTYVTHPLNSDGTTYRPCKSSWLGCSHGATFTCWRTIKDLQITEAHFNVLKATLDLKATGESEANLLTTHRKPSERVVLPARNVLPHIPHPLHHLQNTTGAFEASQSSRYKGHIYLE